MTIGSKIRKNELNRKFQILLSIIFISVFHFLYGYPELLFYINLDDYYAANNISNGPTIVIYESLGDLNDDGYNDIMVKTGERYIFYGGPDMDTIPDMNADDFYGYMYLEDFNGDGYNEIFGWHHFYFGSDTLNTEPDIIFPRFFNPYFGWVYHIIGDVNSDGFSDIAGYALETLSGANNGWVNLYLGGPNLDTIPEYTFVGDHDKAYLSCMRFFGQYEGNSRHYRFNYDVNLDGVDDLILKRSNDWDGAYPPYPYPEDIIFGQYLIYYGGDTLSSEPDTIINRNFTSVGDTIFRNNIFSFFEDFNNDGYYESISATDYYNEDGFIYIDNNSENSLGYPLLIKGGEPNTEELEIYTIVPQNEGYTPKNFSFPGDVNGDGYKDLARFSNMGGFNGQVCIFLGGPQFMPYPIFCFNGSFNTGFDIPGPYIGTGHLVKYCGDVDGDGIDDIMFTALDNTIHPFGSVYVYKGDSSWTNPLVINNELTSFPENYKLDTPYPNPANASITIPFELPERLNVKITIYDINGRIVEQLVNKKYSVGKHQINWNSKSVASGIYYIKLNTRYGIITTKTTIVK